MKLDMFLKRCYFKKSEKSECKKSSKNILDVWLYEQDGEATLENATTDEEAQAKWLSVRKIKDLYNSGEMIKSLYYFFDIIATD